VRKSGAKGAHNPPHPKKIMKIHIMRILAFLFINTVVFMASAKDVSFTMPADGKPAVVFEIPASAKITSSNNYVNIRTTNMSLHVWAVPGAKTADDLLPRAGELIKSEFIKFSPNSTRDITIAGAPAKHVTGSGNEADDGDPGNAEVVLFAVGGQVFVGCIHGEFNDAARAHAPMMAVLKTAHAPPE
jgi:hypothetical protein